MTDLSPKADSGRFCAMLRRISCFRSLPTHPSDHILDSKTIKSKDQKENPKADATFQVSANPGIVARLMGLDSLPQTNWVPRKGAPDSVLRSKSLSFADYMLEFDLSQAQHRRVRTSVSFREVPELSREQKHNLVVVYLDSVNETKGMRSKEKKSEMVSGDLKQRNEQRSKKKENIRERAPVQKKEDQGNKKIFKSRDEPTRASTYSSSKAGIGNRRNGAKRLDLVPAHKKSTYRKDVASLRGKSPLNPVNQKKLLDEPRIARKRKFQPVKVQPACDSPQSSPVSDRNINDRAIQQERPLSEAWGPRELNLSGKSSPEVSYTDDLRVGAIKNKEWDTMDCPETPYYMEVVGKLLRLAENDIRKSTWIGKNFLRFEGFEEAVCIEFGQQILDVLLYQVAGELVEISQEDLLHAISGEDLYNLV